MWPSPSAREVLAPGPLEHTGGAQHSGAHEAAPSAVSRSREEAGGGRGGQEGSVRAEPRRRARGQGVAAGATPMGAGERVGRALKRGAPGNGVGDPGGAVDGAVDGTAAAPCPRARRHLEPLSCRPPAAAPPRTPPGSRGPALTLPSAAPTTWSGRVHPARPAGTNHPREARQCGGELRRWCTA